MSSSWSWLRKLFGSVMTEPQAGRGRLWIVSAPSGAGKTSLVRELCRRRPQLTMSCSYTTRPRRPNEREGVDYHFIDRERFETMAAAGYFLEHAEVFGNFYATGKPDTEALLAAGRNVVLEIDWQGAAQARSAMSEARSIFILPPSYEELERRLRGRGSDSEEVIQRRLGEAIEDMSHWQEFDYVVINDVFDQAADRLEAILDGHGAASERGNAQLRRQIQAVLA